MANEQLATELDTLVRQTGSQRKVAIALGLDPTTLARSLSARAFAKSTRLKIADGMAAAKISLARPTRQNETSPSADMLHILQELYKLLPKALAALEGTSGIRDSSEVSRDTRQ